MAEFGSNMMAIAIAQLLNMIGIDRLHHSTLQVLIELAQEYMMLLARKTISQSESSSRTKPCVFDLIGTLEYAQVTAEDLAEYISAVSAKKKSKAPFSFPRPEPAAFPTSVSLLDRIEKPIADKPNVEQKNEEMIVDEKPSDEMVIDPKEETKEAMLDEKAMDEGKVEVVAKPQLIYDEAFEMPFTNPFPPFPSKRDQEHLDQLLQEAQVPSWETQAEELIPQSIVEMESPESLQCPEVSFEEAKQTFLKDFIDLPPPPEPEPIPQFDMEQLLFETFENLSMDNKVKPPMSSEDLLALLSFRTGYGVPIPDSTSSGFETKAIINDLLVLRLPVLHSLFGGERIMDHEIRVQEELAALQKIGRRRERERDSGQGKAPVKMSAAKLAKKRLADIAAGRIPADEPEVAKSEDQRMSVPGTPVPDDQTEGRASEPPEKSPKPQGEKIHCVCDNPNTDYGLFMVACDECEVWFHGSCVNVTQEVPNWLCPGCI